jgi:hypothetical protein
VETDQLRYALRQKWLTYYETNRNWITRMGIWVDCEGHRRPASSFILGTLSVLEPQLTQMFPFVVELSSNPDRIVTALGLNFSPDQQLQARVKPAVSPQIQAVESHAVPKPAINSDPESAVRLLPASSTHKIPVPSTPVLADQPDVKQVSRIDEGCSGQGRENHDSPLPGNRPRRI